MSTKTCSSEEHNGCDSHNMAIHNTILGDGPNILNWPTIDNVYINMNFILLTLQPCMLFPTLFPYGTGDPTYPGLGQQRPVSPLSSLGHVHTYVA